MNETGIIWSEKTWNPMSGCEKITEGCKFCYAFTLAEQRRGTRAFPNGFNLTIREHKLKEPFNLKEPTMIFTNSMSDLFWDRVPKEYRDRIVDVMEQTPQHEYQVLTKRPDEMLKFSKQRKLPSNFWAGTTIENQRNAYRIDILNKINTEIKFISAEPLIGSLIFSDDQMKQIQWMITGGESGTHLWKDSICEKRALVRYDRQQKEWVPREDRLDWVRRLRDQCIQNDVKFFHKQHGGAYPEAAGRLLDGEFWSEMPRYPGDKKQIDNAYLRFIESGKVIPKNKKEQLLQQSLF